MGHPVLVWRGGTRANCEVKDHPEDAGSREGEDSNKSRMCVCVCVCNSKDQPSPPPRPIETHRGPERQVSKSPAGSISAGLFFVCRTKAGAGYFGCVRVCCDARDPPGRGRAGRGQRERGPRRAGCPLSLARTRPGQTMPRVGWGRLLSPSFIHSLFKVGRRERS